MSTRQQATRKNHLAYYQNKDWCGLLLMLLYKQSPYSGKKLQKIASLVAAHLYQSIASCTSSSHKKAVETLQKKKFLVHVRCLSSDTIQITTIRHASINVCIFSLTLYHKL